MSNKNEKEKLLESPCSITEAVQIARGVAEDIISEYQNRTSLLQVSTSIQLELLKDIVFKSGLITEEEFRDQYVKAAEEFNEKRKAQPAMNPEMKIKASDIEVNTSK